MITSGGKVFEIFMKMNHFKTEVYSVQGLRNHNEDNCVAHRIGKETFFLAVADGMGGKAGGELASKLALSSVIEFLNTEFKDTKKDKNLKSILEKSFLIAQTAIADHNVSNPALRGMGTTMTAVLVDHNKYAWANLGDSRTYLLSEGKLRLITEDHTYIHDFYKSQNKELPQAIINQYKNVVTKIIDGGIDRPDIFPSGNDLGVIREGDLFLLCSDGLIIDKIGDLTKNFVEIIGRNTNLRDISRKLIEWALENGSDDNISVVLGLWGSMQKILPDEDYKTIRIIPGEQKKTD